MAWRTRASLKGACASLKASSSFVVEVPSETTKSEFPWKVASASGDCREVMMSMSPALRAFVIAVASV